MRQSTLSRAELFNRLLALGAAKATVDFAGGGDEGGVENITLTDAAGNELPISLEENYSHQKWDGEKFLPAEPNTPNQDLAMALGAPVYERYFTFAGDFYVSGTVDYDVVAGTVKMNKSERVESYEDSEEDL